MEDLRRIEFLLARDGLRSKLELEMVADGKRGSVGTKEIGMGGGEVRLGA